MKYLHPLLILTLFLVLQTDCTVSDESRELELDNAQPLIKNVVLISIDALRPDHLGTYGYLRETSPNIDKLAKTSWGFEAAYAPIPRTGPSVASMLTGMFTQRIRRWSVPDEMDTVAELLAEQGWTTVAAVDNANLSEELGYGQGFQVYRETWEEKDNEIDRTHLITETAIEHLENFAETNERFFVWLHYVNPHRPYSPPETFAAEFMNDAYFDDTVRLPQTSGYIGGIRPGVYVKGEHRLAYYIAQYDGEVAFTDNEIGKVLSVLKNRVALDNTLIIITSDHGEGLGEGDVYFKHGPTISEPHVRVPLIVTAANKEPTPKRITTPVGLIDITPTILEMVGIQDPRFDSDRAAYPLAGQSLASTHRGEIPNHRPYIFFASRRYWGIRSGDWKLISRTGDSNKSRESRFQLYNLASDPEESFNLYADEPARANELLQLLRSRRSIQRTATRDSSERYDALSKEALDNLRTLGYIQ